MVGLIAEPIGDCLCVFCILIYQRIRYYRKRQSVLKDLDCVDIWLADMLGVSEFGSNLVGVEVEEVVVQVNLPV